MFLFGENKLERLELMILAIKLNDSRFGMRVVSKLSLILIGRIFRNSCTGTHGCDNAHNYVSDLALFSELNFGIEKGATNDSSRIYQITRTKTKLDLESHRIFEKVEVHPISRFLKMNFPLKETGH